MTGTALSPLLNSELIERALQSYHNVNSAGALLIKACNFKLSSASGENFCSLIYEVNVEYTINGNTETKSFIVKLMLPEIAAIGSNEEAMFKTVLPAMEKCLNCDGVNNIEDKLHARCLLGERTKDEVYVLENLNSLGYYCADRKKGLNLEQALVLMRKIAKFHAASMIFAKKFPAVVKSLRGSLFEKGASDATTQAIAFGGFRYVSKLIENWPSYESLSEKVQSIMPRFNSLVMDVVDANKSLFNVINHGDVWVNNFLYKYDSAGKPLDVLFVDFQNSFWGSCGYDLNWFLYTSLELSVLKEKRSHLIQTYYDALKQTLLKHNYAMQEIPTFEHVVLEIKRCAIIGLYTSLCELPIVALEKSQGLDCNSFCQPEKMDKLQLLMYANPRVKETLEYTLKYFEDMNTL